MQSLQSKTYPCTLGNCSHHHSLHSASSISRHSSESPRFPVLFHSLSLGASLIVVMPGLNDATQAILQYAVSLSYKLPFPGLCFMYKDWETTGVPLLPNFETTSSNERFDEKLPTLLRIRFDLATSFLKFQEHALCSFGCPVGFPFKKQRGTLINKSFNKSINQSL